MTSKSGSKEITVRVDNEILWKFDAHAASVGISPGNQIVAFIESVVKPQAVA